MALRVPEERDAHDLGVAALVDPVAALPFDVSLAAIVDRCLDADEDWLVLVDPGARPVRLVERAALLRSEPFEHRVAMVALGTPVAEGARLATRRPRPERFQPLVCCDGTGRYVGLVRIDRILESLAA